MSLLHSVHNKEQRNFHNTLLVLTFLANRDTPTVLLAQLPCILGQFMRSTTPAFTAVFEHFLMKRTVHVCLHVVRLQLLLLYHCFVFHHPANHTRLSVDTLCLSLVTYASVTSHMNSSVYQFPQCSIHKHHIIQGQFNIGGHDSMKGYL